MGLLWDSKATKLLKAIQEVNFEKLYEFVPDEQSPKANYWRNSDFNQNPWLQQLKALYVHECKKLSAGIDKYQNEQKKITTHWEHEYEGFYLGSDNMVRENTSKKSGSRETLLKICECADAAKDVSNMQDFMDNMSSLARCLNVDINRTSFFKARKYGFNAVIGDHRVRNHFHKLSSDIVKLQNRVKASSEVQ